MHQHQPQDSSSRCWQPLTGHSNHNQTAATTNNDRVAKVMEPADQAPLVRLVSKATSTRQERATCTHNRHTTVLVQMDTSL